MDSHVVVKELLELLVDKVDGDLLEAVVLKDLKASNVEHSTEVGLFLRRKQPRLISLLTVISTQIIFLQSTDHGGVDQSLVTFLDQPLEDAVVDGPANTTDSVGRLNNPSMKLKALTTTMSPPARRSGP